jgi:hypothetical protein
MGLKVLIVYTILYSGHGKFMPLPLKSKILDKDRTGKD